MSNIGFIGLGNMGAGMAANLVKAGHTVFAFDIAAETVSRSVEAGCKAAPSAAAAVAEADVVITMLPTGAHVRQVWADDILPNVRQPCLGIDCSTIDVESSRSVAKLAEDRGVRFADAPVSGGVMAAEAGTLAFMVGCAHAAFAEVEAVLSPMARAVIYAGDAGAGQAAKICNNMLLGISMMGVCEAFALAEKLGLDATRFFDIADKSSGQCWSLTSYCPWPGPVQSAPANRNYEGGFMTALMLKDLKLSQEAAARAGASTPLGAQAEALYALFDQLGYGRKDFSAILQLFRGNLEALQGSSAS